MLNMVENQGVEVHVVTLRVHCGEAKKFQGVCVIQAIKKVKDIKKSI